MYNNLLLQQNMWRILDYTAHFQQLSPLHSFAMDDALCTVIGKGESPHAAHFWIHSPTVVLGIQDGKLPFLEERITLLQQQGYHVVIRNSGGLAVVLDEGILNLSLLLPETEKAIAIEQGYQTMYTLIQQAFSSYSHKIEAYEIKGSYCPGSFDLSIDGKKFAGISQRRVRNGVAVQIYLCVTGSGSRRAESIQAFYNYNKEEVSPALVIEPTVMASLSELLGEELSVYDVMTKLLHALHLTGTQLISTPLSHQEQQLMNAALQRLIQRNDILKRG